MPSDPVDSSGAGAATCTFAARHAAPSEALAIKAHSAPAKATAMVPKDPGVVGVTVNVAVAVSPGWSVPVQSSAGSPGPIDVVEQLRAPSASDADAEKSACGWTSCGGTLEPNGKLRSRSLRLAGAGNPPWQASGQLFAKSVNRQQISLTASA